MHKQTDRQTDTTKIMVTWPWTNIRLWSRENKLANVAAYYSVLQARTTNYDLVKLTALYEVTVTEQNRQKLVTEHH